LHRRPAGALFSLHRCGARRAPSASRARRPSQTPLELSRRLRRGAGDLVPPGPSAGQASMFSRSKSGPTGRSKLSRPRQASYAFSRERLLSRDRPESRGAGRPCAVFSTYPMRSGRAYAQCLLRGTADLVSAGIKVRLTCWPSRAVPSVGLTGVQHTCRPCRLRCQSVHAKSEAKTSQGRPERKTATTAPRGCSPDRSRLCSPSKA